MRSSTPSRRAAIKSALIFTGGLLASSHLRAAKDIFVSDTLGQTLPTRRLGKTGLQVTRLGVGGRHTGLLPKKEAQRAIEIALEKGVRFFDNAWRYLDGRCEKYYGKYLTPKYRDQVVIMTKSANRDLKGMRRELEQSLKRMKTDYVDIWCLHDLKDEDEAKQLIDEGLFDVMRQAKEDGLAKNLGFSGHRSPHANKLFAQTYGDEFGAVLMPINAADPSYLSFIEITLPTLQEKDIGILAMKTLGNGGLLGRQLEWGRHKKENLKPRPVIPNLISIREAKNFVYSLPVDCALCGYETPEQLSENIDWLAVHKPYTEDERNAIIAKIQHIAATGEMETYKV